MSDRTDIRLECLRLACNGQPGGSLFNADQVLERADRYHDWVTKPAPEPIDDTVTPLPPSQPNPRTSRKAPVHARKSGR